MDMLEKNDKSHLHKKEAVTVVIPTLNEEQNLLSIIESCKKYCSEIIVVDGHSVDNTVKIAEKAGAKIVLDHKKGKGDAIRTCISHISKEITVFIDADGSHEPDDIPKLVQPILEDTADHVTGSRAFGGSSELHGGFNEFMRLVGSSIFTGFIGWKFKTKISDSQNGFRSLKTEVLRNLDLKENITTIEQEMIIKTFKKGYRMGEVPTHEHKRKFGESHIKLRKVAFRYVYSMLKYLYF